MSNKKIIFVHGYTASSEVNWYPNISKELDSLGIDHSIPDLPGDEHPHSKAWLEIIDREVNSTDKPVILVGHSLGTRAILLYLDKFNREIDAVILVASMSNNIDVYNKRSNTHLFKDFIEYAVDINKIKKLVGTFIVMHSKDDTVINYEDGVEIAKELGAELRMHMFQAQEVQP